MLRALLTLTIPVSLGIVAFLIPISQIGRWSLGQVPGLVLVPMDSEWRDGGQPPNSCSRSEARPEVKNMSCPVSPRVAGLQAWGKESELSATGCFCSGKSAMSIHLLALQSWPLCPGSDHCPSIHLKCLFTDLPSLEYPSPVYVYP